MSLHAFKRTRRHPVYKFDSIHLAVTICVQRFHGLAIAGQQHACMRANECPPATRPHEKEHLREHARGTASRFCSPEKECERERESACERACVFARAHTHTNGFRGRDGREGKEEREHGAEDKGDT
jgi:hypothetical protein